MSQISVILKRKVEGLGNEKEVIKVSEGYARNYLFSRGLAEPFNSSNAMKMKKEMEDQNAKMARAVAHAEAKREQIDGKKVVIKSKQKDGKLFGTVGHKSIADAVLSQLGMEIDKKRVESPIIRSLGEYEAKVRFHQAVFARLVVEVVGE